MIRFILSPLLFAVLGPLVGIVLLGFKGGSHILGALFFAYLFGALPAAFAGLLYAVCSRLFMWHSTHWAMGGCIGAASGYFAMWVANWLILRLHSVQQAGPSGLALPSLWGTSPLIWAGVGSGAACGAIVSYLLRTKVLRKDTAMLQDQTD